MDIIIVNESTDKKLNVTLISKARSVNGSRDIFKYIQQGAESHRRALRYRTRIIYLFAKICGAGN